MTNSYQTRKLIPHFNNMILIIWSPHTGAKAGLQDARTMRKENDATKRRNVEMFAHMTDEMSGRNAGNDVFFFIGDQASGFQFNGSF